MPTEIREERKVSDDTKLLNEDEEPDFELHQHAGGQHAGGQHAGGQHAGGYNDESEHGGGEL
jgi:hypothetical protein